MKQYFGYIRVSTQRQGIHGVSLIEQKGAIETYAARTGLSIVAWFEERETAAKRGRKTFTKMLAELSRGKADGIVIHKIDRGARNLRDWADLGELIDHGIDVHFAHDALDMRSRGGRLSADIQAVVAADYIRNLREETRKGFYGRLKQGLYPLNAPVGYLDTGRGKPKEIDPIRGPLVREAFELYASGDWNFDERRAELERRGLRGRRNTPQSLNGVSTLLNNPFYFGLIHIRKTNELFEGVHRPLISKTLYDRVQAVMRDRREGSRPTRHDFLFRRLIRCDHCGRYLTGERHKGRFIYYRCHGRTCQGTTINQDMVDSRLRALFSLLSFDPVDLRDLRDMLADLRRQVGDERADQERAVHLQLGLIEQRLTRLTDVVIDGTIDKETFNERKAALLQSKRKLLEELASTTSMPSIADVIAEKFEQANTAQMLYESELPSEKRSLVESLSSNLAADGKNLAITLKSPFQDLVNLRNSDGSDLHRGAVRTFPTKQVFTVFYHAARCEFWYPRTPPPNDMDPLSHDQLDNAA